MSIIKSRDFLRSKKGWLSLNRKIQNRKKQLKKKMLAASRAKRLSRLKSVSLMNKPTKAESYVEEFVKAESYVEVKKDFDSSFAGYAENKEPINIHSRVEEIIHEGGV